MDFRMDGEDPAPGASAGLPHEPPDDTGEAPEGDGGAAQANHRLRLPATFTALALMAVISASILGMAFSNMYTESFPSRLWGAMCLGFWALCASVLRGRSDHRTNVWLGAVVAAGLCISVLLLQTLWTSTVAPNAWTVGITLGAILAWDAAAMWFACHCLLGRPLPSRREVPGAVEDLNAPALPARAAGFPLQVGRCALIVGVLGVEVVFSRMQARDLVGTLADAAPRIGARCVIASPGLGADVTLLTPSLDGPVWLYAQDTGTLERVAPDGHGTMCSWTGAPLHLAGMVRPPDGTLWFIDDNSRVVGHVSSDLRLTEYPIPWDAASAHHTSWLTDYIAYDNLTPQALAYGSGGDLWFINGGGIMGRMTPSGRFARVDHVPSDTIWPSDPVKASDGSRWAVGESGVSRWTAGGPATARTMPGTTVMMQVAPGIDAQLWMVVLDDQYTSSVLRYDTRTDRFVSYTAPRPLSEDATGPEHVIPRRDGSIWVTTADSLWRLSRQGTFSRVGSLQSA